MGINAQQVISATGVSGSNATGSISSTVGELVIDTKTAGSTTITQGFHQSKLTITSVNELKNSGISVNIAPNPTHDFVTIKIENTLPKKLRFILYDINGKPIKDGNFMNHEANINFITYNPGTYLLKIFNENTLIKTTKIVKQ
jgi:hypothetical protein